MNGFNNFEKKLKDITAATIYGLDLVGKFVGGEYKCRLEAGHHVITGYLVGSVTYNVVGDKAVRIGASADYAGYVEYGTSHSRAFPCLRPAIDENHERIKSLFKEAVAAKL
jgi:HK97 gp10 family phage protein